MPNQVYTAKEKAVIENFARTLSHMSPEERLQMQEHFTRGHLNHYRLTIKELKGALSAIGMFDGPMDESFTEELANRIILFQTECGFTIDGIFGPECIKKMVELSKQAGH